MEVSGFRNGPVLTELHGEQREGDISESQTPLISESGRLRQAGKGETTRGKTDMYSRLKVRERESGKKG